MGLRMKRGLRRAQRNDRRSRILPTRDGLAAILTVAVKGTRQGGFFKLRECAGCEV
jgi:hypothetical protein